MKRYSVYTDGSYTKGSCCVSGGIVIIDDDTKELLTVRQVFSSKGDFVEMRNAGGEVVAACWGIQEAVMMANNESARVTVYYDYTGVANFITGSWTPRKKGMILYRDIIRKIMIHNKNVEIKFVKVKAHTGVKYNELADCAARAMVPEEFRYALKDTHSL